MWVVFKELQDHGVLIDVVSGLFVGWMLAWMYFRQRIWVMQQRLWDYSERRTALQTPEDRRLMCPVCKSRSLRRSNKQSLGVVWGSLFGRAPYRCERCLNVSMQKARSLYRQTKRVDTLENLADERKRFVADLEVARRMKNLYPDAFHAQPTLRRAAPPR